MNPVNGQLTISDPRLGVPGQLSSVKGDAFPLEMPIRVPQDTLLKMIKNAGKSFVERRKRSPNDDEVPSLESLIARAFENPLQLSVTAYAVPASQRKLKQERPGKEKTMQDAHFFAKTPQGMLLGVFDGHGGSEVAKYANEQFQERFLAMLSNLKGDIYQVFKNLIEEIHQEVCNKEQWQAMGTTAVVSFVDPIQRVIYTATLGDSEANIYRKGELIPLSCVRNWGSKKDAARASLSYLQNDKVSLWCAAKNWPREPAPKKLRYPFSTFGVNVSRAIGDQELNQVFTNRIEGGVVSHKPKITVSRVEPGDIVLLASDGLMDFVTETQIIQALQESEEGCQAQALVEKALTTSADDITVVVLNISLPSAAPYTIYHK